MRPPTPPLLSSSAVPPMSRPAPHPMSSSVPPPMSNSAPPATRPAPPSSAPPPMYNSVVGEVGMTLDTEAREVLVVMETAEEAQAVGGCLNSHVEVFL